jgi:hypothetical protein
MKINKSFWSCSLLFIFIFSNTVLAQVPVREEPHHKVFLENEYVRLIDVHIAPHDTTLTHIHAAPSVIVFLTKSKIGTQIVGDSPVVSNVMPAQTSYAAYDTKPITHRVWNRGDSMFHVMDIEMVKTEPATDSCAVLSEGATLRIQQKLVRVYNIDFNSSTKFKVEKSTCAYLLINVSGNISAYSGNVVSGIQPGKFVFFSPQKSFEINASKDAQCVLLQLK